MVADCSETFSVVIKVPHWVTCAGLIYKKPNYEIRGQKQIIAGEIGGMEKFSNKKAHALLNTGFG
jgi:hypothetical protein